MRKYKVCMPKFLQLAFSNSSDNLNTYEIKFEYVFNVVTTLVNTCKFLWLGCYFRQEFFFNSQLEARTSGNAGGHDGLVLNFLHENYERKKVLLSVTAQEWCIPITCKPLVLNNSKFKYLPIIIYTKQFTMLLYRKLKFS